MLTWELLGAVVGAGLASGREIAAFFTQYGGWGSVGILLATLTMGWLTGPEMPSAWQGKWPMKLWEYLLTAMLMATGGAMLSGSGMVAAMLLPVRHAEGIGAAMTFLLACVLAYRTRGGLAWVSRVLLLLLTAVILTAFVLPRRAAVLIADARPAVALAKGLTYGGFNAALQCPILSAAPQDVRTRGRSVRRAACLLCLLLLLGHGALLRHPALVGEPMPFIRLTASLGRAGHLLGACSMYLAILSTLTACLRGLRRHMGLPAGVIAVSLLGFSGVVEAVYPLLGGGCLLWLAAAKFTNSTTRPFISRSDML